MKEYMMKFSKKGLVFGQGLLKVFEEDLDGPFGKGVLVIPQGIQWIAPDALDDLKNLERVIYTNTIFIKSPEYAEMHEAIHAKREPGFLKASANLCQKMRKECVIDWRKFPKLKSVVVGYSRYLGFERKYYRNDELFLTENSIQDKATLGLPDHITSNAVFTDDLIMSVVQPIWDEAKSRVSETLRMKLPGQQTLFLPMELVRKYFADTDLLKESDETLEAWFKKTMEPFNLKGDYSLARYKKSVNRQAFLFILRGIYLGVKRLTESSALSEEIQTDAKKKVYVILKLKAAILDASKLKNGLISNVEAKFLLHEGKGRLKRLLEEFMPKVKTKLELLANSEVLEEVSEAAAASSHALKKM